MTLHLHGTTESHTDIGGRVYEAGDPADDVLGRLWWIGEDSSKPAVPVQITFTAASADQLARYGAGVYMRIHVTDRDALAGVELPGGEQQVFLNERAKLWLYEQLSQNINIIQIQRQMAAATAAAARPASMRDRIARFMRKAVT